MINSIITQDMEDIYSIELPWKELDGKMTLLTGVYGMFALYIVYFLFFIRNKKI